MFQNVILSYRNFAFSRAGVEAILVCVSVFLFSIQSVQIHTIAAELNNIWALLILKIDWLLVNRRIGDHRVRDSCLNRSICYRSIHLNQSFMEIVHNKFPIQFYAIKFSLYLFCVCL